MAYYVICDDDSKHESMTKEQILTAIQQALSGQQILDPDGGFITKVKELNTGDYVTFWVGTRAEYNALGENTPKNCIPIITDDTSREDLEKKLKELEEKDNAADSIVARGEDGDWTWEMWKSGKAVCWGTASLGDVGVNTRWGSSEDTYPWRESTAFTKDFPEGLFNAPPQFLDITVVNSSAAVFVSRYLEDLTATNTGKFTLSRPTSMTVKNVKLGFYAIGRWKNSDGSGNNLETALSDIIALQEQYIGGEAV